MVAGRVFLPFSLHDREPVGLCRVEAYDIYVISKGQAA